MGISLRHHVLSLVAVFLMLLVGLLVGIGLSSEPELTRAMQDLNREFKALMEENAAATRDAKAQERFARAALPRLVSGKLDGQRVALVVTARPEDSPAVTDIIEALRAGGARVPYHVVCRKGFAQRACSAFGGNEGVAEACEKAAQAIARGVATADEDELWRLKRRGLIRIRGRVEHGTPTAAVVVGGAREDGESLADVIDRPLVETLIAAGIQRIVGCEDRPGHSYIETYRELGVSTVDNVGLARGQVSLVFALAGKHGNYGDGPSADQEFAALE